MENSFFNVMMRESRNMKTSELVSQCNHSYVTKCGDV